MRPQSFRQQMPQGRPFNHYQGPRTNFGPRPARFAHPGMMPPPGPGPGPGPIPGAGFGQKGAVPRLESFMDTANRFLATAQSFTPIVQQATPMFRNLPALWKLYKGFQSLPKNADSKAQAKPEKARKGKESRFDRYEEHDREERFARQESRRARDSYKQNELSESPAYEERAKPRRTPRPSMPRTYQPDYHFDE